MTEKELRKLSKTELLELLIRQTRRVNDLEAKCQNLEAQLQDRSLCLSESGNIAEAALKLYRIFETAQEAADAYVDAVRRNSEQGETP